jgi:hypothetical protein
VVFSDGRAPCALSGSIGRLNVSGELTGGCWAAHGVPLRGRGCAQWRRAIRRTPSTPPLQRGAHRRSRRTCRAGCRSAIPGPSARFESRASRPSSQAIRYCRPLIVTLIWLMNSLPHRAWSGWCRLPCPAAETAALVRTLQGEALAGHWMTEAISAAVNLPNRLGSFERTEGVQH